MEKIDIPKTNEILKKGWARAVTHEKLTFEEVDALRDAIIVLHRIEVIGGSQIDQLSNRLTDEA